MTRDTFWFPRQCGAQPIEVEIFAVEAAAVVVVVFVVDEVVAGERLGTGIEVEVMVEFIHRPACWLLTARGALGRARQPGKDTGKLVTRARDIFHIYSIYGLCISSIYSI